MFRYLTFIFFTLTAYAEEDKIFTCEINGRRLQRCTFVQKVLTEIPAYETEYSIFYSYLCHGHETAFGLKSGALVSVFRQGADNERITMISSNSINTFDPNPVATKRLSFHPECKVHINEVIQKPSEKTFNEWKTEKNNEQKNLNILNHSLEDLQRAILYRSASQLFESLGNVFLGQLSISVTKVADFKKQLKEFEPILSSLGAKDGVLTLQQKIAFRNIFDFGDRINSVNSYTDSSGSSKKVTDFLSEEDQKVMEEIKNLGLNLEEDLEKRKNELLPLMDASIDKIFKLENEIKFWEIIMEGERTE